MNQRWIITLLMFGLLACQTPSPRVGDVWSKRLGGKVGAADVAIFTHDRATRLRPAATDQNDVEHGERFTVTWHGTGIDLVRFEYRQVNTPTVAGQLDDRPSRGRTSEFVIQGQGYRDGGTISAWRVTLWRGDQQVAEKHSSLW